MREIASVSRTTASVTSGCGALLSSVRFNLLRASINLNCLQGLELLYELANLVENTFSFLKRSLNERMLKIEKLG